MTETWEAITSRRNVRSFTEQPISETDLERICEGARRTPSVGNRQHRDLVVVVTS
ncbi:nitroreductase family protein [Kineosporia succinea]|uniref:Nitroreductase n=1 Tax=Kineosporia succinea TaxID=84632 RepID=A0ABT9P7V1_9ACTN|nr:nitroreductase family protein [Kineosporia succinea]MDP9828771.1 nitroreductase [Kineosporia succinea]